MGIGTTDAGAGRRARGRRGRVSLLVACAFCAGCYTPLHSPGIPARELPDCFRMPLRTAGAPLNFSTLVAAPPLGHPLGPGDVLEVMIPGLFPQADYRPLRIPVLETGAVHLPGAEPVAVAGLTVSAAQARINAALADGLLNEPGAVDSLAERATVNVLVLGAVRQPGVHALPRYENDVGHALAAAGGLTEEAGDVIEIHRRGAEAPPVLLPPQMMPPAPPPEPQWAPEPAPDAVSWQPDWSDAEPDLPAEPAVVLASYQSYRTAVPRRPAEPRRIHQAAYLQPAAPLESPPIAYYGPYVAEAGAETVVRIPLRGADPVLLRPEVMVLNPTDVVVVPNRAQQVFYVVGKLSEDNRVRFSVGDDDRNIGNGFLLPPDREIDVVTAVAMAGYIDPIDSPTTVTVHRTLPDGAPLLVKVDLVLARTDPRENLLVQPGDIIYLNPDCAWYFRRTFDRVLERGLGTAAGVWVAR